MGSIRDPGEVEAGDLPRRREPILNDCLKEALARLTVGGDNMSG